MANRRPAPLSPRKQPSQERSTELVDAILQAAIQVLAAEGAQRFTTIRVAEKAGVSVGSLYQYFPNKAAILFRLQSDEWRQNTELLRSILADSRQPPLDRLRQLVHRFLQSECDEAAVRVALSDAAPLYRDAPEASEAKGHGTRAIRTFMRELLPEVPESERLLAGDLITATLSAVGKDFSGRPRTAPEIEAYAKAMAGMFCAYVQDLGARKGKSVKRSRDGAAPKTPRPLARASR